MLSHDDWRLGLNVAIRIHPLQLLLLFLILLTWRLTPILLLFRHSGEYVTIFYLCALVPAALDLGLVHLHHLLITKILIVTALVIVAWSKEQFVAQFFPGNLMICTWRNVSLVTRVHFAVELGWVAALFAALFLLATRGCCITLRSTLSIARNVSCSQLLLQILLLNGVVELIQFS